jgi:transmembrane sensor
MGSDKRRRQQTVREASNWISRIESGDAECMPAFLEWLERGDQHTQAVREIVSLTYTLRRLSYAEWDQVLANVRRRPSNVVPLHPEMPHTRPPRQAFRAVAAAGAAFAILAVGAFFFATGQSGDRYRTGNGETRLLALADGSRVHLNASTEIRVRLREYAREVDLVEGEALFDVTHDAARPFRVRARGAMAQALGTQFDVRLDGDELRIAISRGRVAVSADSSAAAFSRVVVPESHMAVLNVRHRGRVTEVRTLSDYERGRALSWIGFVDLNNISLSDAVVRFNAANTTQLVLDDPEIANFRLGGRFSLVDPMSFVDTLTFIGQVVAVARPEDPGVIHLKKKTTEKQSKILASSPSLASPRMTREVFGSDALMEYPRIKRIQGTPRDRKPERWRQPVEA